MGRTWIALVLGLCSAGAFAASGDPLQSDDCRRALDALQVRESQTATDARGPGHTDPLLAASRHAAAIACLANRPDPDVRPHPEAPPSRFAQPPLAVPPVTLAVPPATTLPRPVPLTPIVPVSPQPGTRPQFITSCDAGGCWANDGSRLNRVGPNLSAGSRGLCVQQGNLLTCP